MLFCKVSLRWKSYILAFLLSICTICTVYCLFSLAKSFTINELFENKDNLDYSSQIKSFTYNFPYLRLNKGRYEVSVNYQLLQNTADIEIRNEYISLCSGKLLPSSKQFMCRFVIGEDSDLQLRLITDPVDNLQVEKISVRQVFAKDWAYLIPICLLLFMLYFKLINWIIKIKYTQHVSKIELMFVLFFVVMLFIPMSHITKAEYNLREKHKLGEYPSLLEGGYFNNEYGTRVEKWFNGRFAAREQLLDLYTYLRRLLNAYQRNDKIYVGKDEWFFKKEDFEKQALSQVELHNIITGVNAFNKFCNDNRIKCYIEIVPRRIEFAAQNGNRLIAPDNVDKGYVIAKEVTKRTGIDVIYPLAEMLQANKSDMIYFKTDHHWTEWGAYIGYLALLERIRQDFPHLKILSEDDFYTFYDYRVRAIEDRIFWEGSWCNELRLSLTACPLHTRYHYYQHKNAQYLTIIQDKDLMTQYKYKFGNDLKVALLGNSFAENLFSFMAYTFNDYMKIRTNSTYNDNMNFSRWRHMLSEYKPDVLVIVVESWYAPRLADLAN